MQAQSAEVIDRLELATPKETTMFLLDRERKSAKVDQIGLQMMRERLEMQMVRCLEGLASKDFDLNKTQLKAKVHWDELEQRYVTGH